MTLLPPFLQPDEASSCICSLDELPPPVFGIQALTLWARVDLPTRLRLAQLPLAPLQNPTARCRHKLVYRVAKVFTDSIHCLGYLFRCVSCHILLHGFAEELAPRLFSAAGKALRIFKYVIWN